MLSQSPFAVLVSLASLATFVSASQSLCLKVTGPASVNTVENLVLSTTLTNTGDETLKILNDPRGPLNKSPTDTFAITDATGTRPSFTGIKVKYVPKAALEVGAFTVLAPGESVSIEHNLGRAYNFTTSGAANYDIHARNSFLVVNNDSTISTIYADSTAHSAHISGKLAVPRPPSTPSKRAYVGCSAAQQTTISAAATAAQTLAANAKTYITKNTASTTRYTTWFGVFSTANRATVLSYFTKLSTNTFATYTYDCTCTEADTYAEVDPTVFGKVTLCPLFWSAPTSGTDTKAGTIVHESTHFNANGGSDDYEYGQADCKALAKSNPTQAINNADSLQYFAENNPVLA